MTQQTPPTLGISQALTAFNSREILVILGHTRMTVDQNDGKAAFGGQPEFFQTLAMSPQAAQELHARLTQTLMSYASTYGVIPTDPHFKVAEDAGAMN